MSSVPVQEPSPSKPRVSAQDLGKTYRLYEAPSHRLMELLTRRQRHREHRALEGVSFQLGVGETLGVVGQNGAGKSTLLKLLAGVLQPSTGTLSTEGTVSSILELGAGFHPDFSGRANIRINAAMLGLDEQQLEQRLPAIEEFCELGDFLDQPVKTYSSGMSMRLAFAIATQIEPDVLIIDEALSVGDGYFQKKCMDRILQLIDGGTSLLFCSHAMYYVSTLCQRVLWLRDGAVQSYGPTDEVVLEYEQFLLEQQASTEPTPGESEGPRMVAEREQRVARLTAVEISADDVPVTGEDAVHTGADLAIELAWYSSDRSLGFSVGLGINRADGSEVFALDSRASSLELSGNAQYRVRFRVPDLPLLKGQYTVHAFLLDEQALHVYDHRVLYDGLAVAPTGSYEFGVVRVPGEVDLILAE